MTLPWIGRRLAREARQDLDIARPAWALRAMAIQVIKHVYEAATLPLTISPERHLGVLGGTILRRNGGFCALLGR